MVGACSGRKGEGIYSYDRAPFFWSHPGLKGPLVGEKRRF